MKNVVFWDVALCRIWVNRRFGGTYRLHLQGGIIRKRRTRVSSWLQTETLVGATRCIRDGERKSVATKEISREGKNVLGLMEVESR
jgi:hypothetical protein